MDTGEWGEGRNYLTNNSGENQARGPTQLILLSEGKMGRVGGGGSVNRTGKEKFFRLTVREF